MTLFQNNVKQFWFWFCHVGSRFYLMQAAEADQNCLDYLEHDYLGPVSNQSKLQSGVAGFTNLQSETSLGHTGSELVQTFSPKQSLNSIKFWNVNAA